MRNEIDREFPDTGGNREFLLNLRQVTVSDRTVCADALVALRIDIRKIDLAPGTRNAAHGSDNNIFRFDQSRLEQRSDGKNNACGITSRTGNECGVADLFPIAFRRTVDRLFQQFRRGMVLAVIFLVLGGGTETEIGAEVEHAHAGFHQGNRIFGSQSVRQCQECRIAFRRDLRHIGSGEFQVHSEEARKDFRDLFSGVLPGCDDA